MSCTLYNSLVIFQLICLKNVTSDIVIEGVVIDALLLALGIILDRAHPIGCNWAFFNRSESFQIVLYTLVIVLIIPIIKGPISLLVLSVLGSIILTLSSGTLAILRFFLLILSDKFSTLPNQFALLHASLLHSKDFFKTDAFNVSLHGSEYKVTGTRLQCLVCLFTDKDLAWWAL